MSQSFIENHKVIVHDNATAAGQTLITPSSGVDTAGYDRCTFMVVWGAIVAGGVQSIEVHQSSDDGAVDTYAACTGTNVTVAATDDDKVTLVEVYRPVERYLKCLVNRATQNSTVECILCVLSGGAKTTTADTSVSGSEFHPSPAEGTA